MKITAIAPVLNEFPWIGYSILAALSFVDEFVYALDDQTSDGTKDLLYYVKEKYAYEKLVILDHPNFHPHDMKAYNAAFNRCIGHATGDAVFFLHPDMIVTQGAQLQEGPLAWWTNMVSYARDFQTVMTHGRATKWKNIHLKKFGFHYFGGYGSANEDFYHSDITGNAYKHYGEGFSKYPFKVADSGIRINHYCELKSYRRRLEKMKLCIKTQHPTFVERKIDEIATQHPRVTLEPSNELFGRFELKKTEEEVPDVIRKHREEFENIQKEAVCG